MSERPFMQLYVSDYLGDTRHLSCEQHGAYLLLLMTMWNAGGSLPDDDAKLARIVCLSVKKWRSIREDIMAFFDLENGVVSHNRLTKEIQKSESKSQSRASAGAKGGHAKALKDNESRLAIAIAEPQHLPDTITRKKKEEPNGSLSETSSDAPKKQKKRFSYPADFEAVWSLYPTDANMSKLEAHTVWVRLDDADKASLAASIPAFLAYCAKNPDYRPIHLNRYIAKRRFDGHGNTPKPETGDTFCAEDGLSTRLHVIRFRNEHNGHDPPRAVQGGKAGYLIPAHWVKAMELRQAHG